MQKVVVGWLFYVVFYQIVTLSTPPNSPDVTSGVDESISTQNVPERVSIWPAIIFTNNEVPYLPLVNPIYPLQA
jgi:hypothetical protein